MTTTRIQLLRTLRLAPLAVAVATGLAACGGGGGGSTTGVAQLSLTDAPICSNVSSVWVTITSVELIGDKGTFTLTLPQPVQEDLTQLINGNTLNLGQITLPAGSYQQMRLILAPNTGSTLNNYVTVGTSTTRIALDTPSDQQSGLKVNGEFTVNANGQTNLTLDFNACRSVVQAGNSGQYLLKPVINLLDDDAGGSISGLVSSANAGAIVMAEDAQGHILRSTVANASGSFLLTEVPVTSGTYNVVIAPPAPASTAPTQNFVPAVVTGVPVTAGATTSLSAEPIQLTSNSSDALYSGSVTVPNSNDDVLIVAQEPIAGNQTISIAFQPAQEPPEGSTSLMDTYSLMLPTVPAQVATYSATGPLSFSSASSGASASITISAYTSEGEFGERAPGQTALTLSGSGDDTYNVDH